ncbi:hypothetical protein IV203_007918 [Nitzschia inconspicua]|uniref:PH domain-containing protein n=1 Tax=Nitzschia inconspicua TaxID=303405 RepID=A0A9K3KZH6_9STRA|nr:hypothetical protein IV203_007918 [Nitzschia inconspicua]
MPEDFGGGESTVTSKDHHHSSTRSSKDASKDDRPIDNAALAALLRESALFVEEGKFDPILYQALQDFRVYYKQKYPKDVKRSGSADKVKRKGKKKSISSGNNTSSDETSAAAVFKDTVATSATILSENDAIEEQHDHTHEDHHHSESAATATAAAAAVTDLEETATVTTNISDHVTENVVDEPTKSVEPIEPIEEEEPLAVAATESVEQLSQDPVETAIPIETAVPIVPAPEQQPTPVTTVSVPPPAAAATSSSSYPQFQDSSYSHTAAASPHNAATKFHLGQAVFGKFVPKVANNLKQAAFNATSKKNAQRAREELGIFSNDLSRQAEASARRKAPTDDYRSSNGDYYDDWCEEHFCKGCACKSRMYSDTTRHVADDTATDQTNATTTIAAPTAAATTTATTSGHIRTDSVVSETTQHHQPHHAPAASVDGNFPAVASTKTFDSTEGVRATKTFDSTEGVRAASTAQTQTNTKTAVPAGAKPYVGTSSFQRPTNPDSNLVVHGWIEQHRRSKMRHVWKQVLASLVKGKKPGEQTTLWIQREIFNPLNGRKELEVLERIPIRLVEEVTLKEFSPDHQFTLKVFNHADELVFRCNGAPADAMMWAQTLRKHQWIARGIIPEEEVEEKKETSPVHSPELQHSEQKQGHAQQHPNQPAASASVSTNSSAMSISELRAICHGAGINTAGMERIQLIHAAEEVKKRGTYFDRPGSHSNHSAGFAANPPQQHPQSQRQLQHDIPHSEPTPTPPPQPRPPSTETVPQDEPSVDPQTAPFDEQEAPPLKPSPTSEASVSSSQSTIPIKLSIKELRAICHGAGINTMGMERQELETAAENVRKRGTYFDPPPGMHVPTDEEIRIQQEEHRRQEAVRAQQEQLRRQQEHEAAVRRQQEEEARKRAAEEQMRLQQEAQARYQQQQAAWARQRQEEDQRRRQAEQQAADEQRRRGEAYRKQQQWAKPSTGQHPQHNSAWNQQHPQQGYPYPQHQQYPSQQQHRQPQYPQQQQQHPQHNHQQQHENHHHSAASEKYAAMANQTGDDGQAVITRIKHDILIHWALQPPQLQMLRPIDTLITTIHKVFPPALGVSGHDYFQKWEPITQADIVGASGLPEDEKLKKSVRKLRFFLHPDKLPHDLSKEQKFMTKMLWDVTSDAWEEFQKHKEDLDWVKS